MCGEEQAEEVENGDAHHFVREGRPYRLAQHAQQKLSALLSKWGPELTPATAELCVDTVCEFDTVPKFLLPSRM